MQYHNSLYKDHLEPTLYSADDEMKTEKEQLQKDDMALEIEVSKQNLKELYHSSDISGIKM